MKEAFEKLKERLEEESQYSCFHCMDRAISIVSEVEAEYINKSTEHINKSSDCSISDEELEQKCSEVLDRMMKDDRYFLHVLIEACAYRVEKLANEKGV